MITKDKVTEIFCIADDFCKEFDKEVAKMGLEYPKDVRRRNQAWRMSRSEIMTILICFHFGSFRNFKHYYLFYVKEHLADLFPDHLSYNRFVVVKTEDIHPPKTGISVHFCVLSLMAMQN